MPCLLIGTVEDSAVDIKAPGDEIENLRGPMPVLRVFVTRIWKQAVMGGSSGRRHLHGRQVGLAQDRPRRGQGKFIPVKVAQRRPKSAVVETVKPKKGK